MTNIASLTATPRILVVDDDPGVRALIAGFLSQNGCLAIPAGDAGSARRYLAASVFDLILLDPTIAGGGEVLAHLQRNTDAPAAIMLSAVGSEVDRVASLELGVRDCIAKPCKPRELLARIRITLANRRTEAVEMNGPVAYRFAGWRLDLIERRLRDPEGAMVALNNEEFALLRAFAEHPRQVLTRDLLREYGWGDSNGPGDEGIEINITRLRCKLWPRDLVRTIHSDGYMFLPRTHRE